MPIPFQHHRRKRFQSPRPFKVVTRASRFGNPFTPDRLLDPAADINPRWRGGVPGTLAARARIIQRAGYTTSCRAIRNAGTISVWELTDRRAAVTWLIRHDNLPEPEPGDIPATSPMPVEPAAEAQTTIW